MDTTTFTLIKSDAGSVAMRLSDVVAWQDSGTVDAPEVTVWLRGEVTVCIAGITAERLFRELDLTPSGR